MSSYVPHLRRSQRSGSTLESVSLSISKTPAESWSGPLLFPCAGERCEGEPRGLVTRLRIKRAKRGSSVQRQRPTEGLPTEAQRQLPLCSKCIIPVFPPKKSTSHRARATPTGLEDGLSVGFTYCGPEVNKEQNTRSKAVLARKLLRTRGLSQKVLRRSRSPSSLKFAPATPYPSYVAPESPLYVLPLTPLRTRAHSRPPPDPEALYTDPALLAHVKPTRENRRVVYARRDRKESEDWDPPPASNSMEIY